MPLGGVWINGIWFGTVPVLAIIVSFLMTLPVLLDLVNQIRHGEWLPACLLVAYLAIGLAIYMLYGKPRAQRQQLAAPRRAFGKFELMSIREVSLSEALALGKLDAHDQARLVRDGELPVEALTEAAILRIDALDPTVRALSHYDPALGRAEARALRERDGTMRGVPWLPKDSLDYPGMPTTSCSRSRSRKAIQHSYPYVQRMQQAGLVALGKSAMPEFGLLGSTEPLAGPVTRNPWSLKHSPGGSSGGAVAAIAAGLVPLAHGSDGGGSIRLPSSCCGVVGLKPGRDSTVRVRARHLVEDLLVSDSLHSRSVRDVAWGFAAAHLDSKRVRCDRAPRHDACASL